VSAVTPGAGVTDYSVGMSDTRIPSLADFAQAEHCVLEDLTVEQPALVPAAGGRSRDASEIVDEVEIRDRLRGRTTRIAIFAEGWFDIEVERRGRRTTHHRLDLRYLDPVPTTRRFHPIRLLKAAGILAGVTGVFAIPAWFGWFIDISLTGTLVAGLATLATLFVAFYVTHEKIVFRTLHGRAPAIRFGAGLGTMRRFRKLVPLLVDAIAEAAEAVGDETAVYLRSEMREHYRLRSCGILSDEECAESTGRILGEFDGPL
jgi:hypothetical protein